MPIHFSVLTVPNRASMSPVRSRHRSGRIHRYGTDGNGGKRYRDSVVSVGDDRVNSGRRITMKQFLAKMENIRISHETACLAAIEV